MPDSKDYMIEVLRQQREEAHNKIVMLIAEANERIAGLMAEIEKLKSDSSEK